MSDRIRIEVQGVPQLRAELRRLGASLSGLIMGKALRAAGEPIRDRAAELAPTRADPMESSQTYRTIASLRGSNAQPRGGRLKKSMTISPDPDQPNTVRVGPDKKAFYAHMVELGTAPHATGGGSSLRWKGKPQTGRMHPGARAKPFLRPAFDEKEEEATERFAQVMREEIEARP
jgi:HK97 gp10 family phage protein